MTRREARTFFGRRKGKEKGKLGEKEERFGSNDEEEKAFELGDNEESVSPTFIRQSGKPCPASSSKITTACLQDELERDSSQVKVKLREWRADAKPRWRYPTAALLFPSLFPFLFPHGEFAPHSFLQLPIPREYTKKLLLCSRLRWTLILGRVQVTRGVIASTPAPEV